MKTVSSGRIIAFALGLTLSSSVLAMAVSDESPAQTPASGRLLLPQEIIITEEPSLTQLRLRMEEAERRAYDTFNRLNDEKRFMTHCSRQEATGSRFVYQMCQPQFVLRAQADYARDHLESYREFMEMWVNPGNGMFMPQIASQPPQAVIEKQRKDYQQKLREVAEEHPEFLQALINYTREKEEFERARDQSD